MDFYRGKSLLEKIAIGKIYFYKKCKDTPFREEIDDADSEIARFGEALAAASAELEELFRIAADKAGEKEAGIFEGQRMLIRDPLYREFVCDAIRNERVNAEYAVAQAQAHFVRMFMSLDDDYVRERAADVADISERLLRILGEGEDRLSENGEEHPPGAGTERLPDMGDLGPAEPSIIAAEELMPSDIIKFDRSVILAFVVRQGAANSHMAILARAMNIPVLLGVDVREDWAGRNAVVDGRSGGIMLDPDPEYLKSMIERQKQINENEERLRTLRGQETVTRSGRKINLYANVSDGSDVDDAVENGAEGIGLFRSEFLYLQASSWPTEEEQFAAYRAAAEAVQGKKVVIRTLDTGADKQLPYLDLTEGPGRDTGYRGIRICLERPEMFRTQLRAVLRASSYGNVAVMFPMITSVEEVRACRKQLALAREELDREDSRILYGDVEAGIMIETPEAVEKSAELAREADFFSIGTNDLIPAILGFDRFDAQSVGREDDAAGSCEEQRDPGGCKCHPAVLRAIRTTVDNGHAAGIWVGICGEMAADTGMTETLVNLGVDELSVAPGALLRVKEKVRDIN